MCAFSLKFDIRFFCFALFYVSFFSRNVLLATRPSKGHNPYEYRVPNFHMKEDSPVGCSRAVSRWVWQAWILFSEKLPEEVSSREVLGLQCPFGAHDMYSAQEHFKIRKGTSGHMQCSKCNKTFNGEYAIDRHLDRRHSFKGLRLPDTYTGGPVLEAIDTRTNKVKTFHSNAAEFMSWGTCLEDYCQVFDVCDRSPHRPDILVYNNRSITYNEAAKRKKRTLLLNGECRAHLLPAVKRQCESLIDSCFPVDSQNVSVKRMNIHTKLSLCEALDSCERYLSRRHFSGTRHLYSESAHLGKLFRPLTSMSGWLIILIVFLMIGLMVGTLVLICCFLETEEIREPKPVSETIDAPAYRSALASTTIATRRHYGHSSSLNSAHGGWLESENFSEETPRSVQSSMNYHARKATFSRSQSDQVDQSIQEIQEKLQKPLPNMYARRATDVTSFTCYTDRTHYGAQTSRTYGRGPTAKTHRGCTPQSIRYFEPQDFQSSSSSSTKSKS